MCRALPGLPHLERLSVAGNALGDEGVGQLGACIGGLGGTVLRHLDVQDIGMGVEGARQLARALPLMARLESLDVSYNQVSDEGVRAIGHGLVVCVREPCRQARCLSAQTSA